VEPPDDRVKPKPTFERFVENIASNYRYLENLPPSIKDRKWKVLKSVSPAEFGTLDLKVLKLVVSYCCYFTKGVPTPSAEYRASSREGYYSLALQMTNEGKLRGSNTKLSSIIKDTKMAARIKTMEE